MSLRMINDALRNKELKKYCPLCGRKFGNVHSDEEHIFPKWLQSHHDLWNHKLTIPNFIRKSYKSVKISICKICNNDRFGKLETRLSPLFRTPDPHSALSKISDLDLAVWLGKIFWLLCRKSHSFPDHRLRDEPVQDRIIPDDIMPGISYLGMFQRTFAMRKHMYSCYNDDPPRLEFYGPPYSIYRFRIDTTDHRFEAFDFADNLLALGVGLRTDNIGLICLFDGGLHRRFRAGHFSFLENQILHPHQFNEVMGRFFYDQTVLDEAANEVTYFWNPILKAVIAAGHTSRFYDPYLAANHDPARYAEIVGRQMFIDPKTMYSDDGATFTTLRDEVGNFRTASIDTRGYDAASGHRLLEARWRQEPPSE